MNAFHFGVSNLINKSVGVNNLVRITPILLSLINKPAKVLFLNNVIDQEIYYQLGVQQTLGQDKSIFFMV